MVFSKLALNLKRWKKYVQFQKLTMLNKCMLCLFHFILQWGPPFSKFNSSAKCDNKFGAKKLVQRIGPKRKTNFFNQNLLFQVDKKNFNLLKNLY